MSSDDPVHVAQRAFRALLSAMSHPGCVMPIDEPVDAPCELAGALAAGALALFDRDVAVWLSPRAPKTVAAWLVAETGCRIVALPAEADFAVLLDARDTLPLDRWNPGTPEDPEQSATLLVHVESLVGGRAATLHGPGIERDVTIAPRGVPDGFWRAWALNTARYPTGVDCFFFDARAVTGLPRTAVEGAP